MLRILGKPTSINVRKVLWACDEINLPYDLELWGDGYRATQASEFLALNPKAMVPVIIDGDFVLSESNAICRYLARRAGRDDLLPTTLQAQALVEQWMDWQASDLNTTWRYAFMALVRKAPAFSDPDLLARSMADWNRSMLLIERQLLATGAYIVGKQFTLADIVIALSINRWQMTPLERPAAPAIAAYCERLRARQGFNLFCANGTP